MAHTVYAYLNLIKLIKHTYSVHCCLLGFLKSVNTNWRHVTRLSTCSPAILNLKAYISTMDIFLCNAVIWFCSVPCDIPQASSQFIDGKHLKWISQVATPLRLRTPVAPTKVSPVLLVALSHIPLSLLLMTTVGCRSVWGVDWKRHSVDSAFCFLLVSPVAFKVNYPPAPSYRT